jgi:colicin import membrane protein
MPTLAELTLTLSQEITRNEHERAAAVAAHDGERTKAMGALPGAAALLQRQAVAIVEAQNDRDEALLDVDGDLREAERLAATRRRTDEDAAEERLRDADDAAERARRTAEDKAKAAFEAAVAGIDRRDLSPGEKVLARADARRTMDRAIDAAQDAFAEARLANQDRLLDDRRAAVNKELAASRENRETATARRQAAEHVFSQSVTASDRLLQVALAAVPGATAVIADFAERRRGIDRRFDEQAAAIRAAFRKARDELRG